MVDFAPGGRTETGKARQERGSFPLPRRCAASVTAGRFTARRGLPGCGKRRSRRVKGRRLRVRRLRACRCVRMETRSPAVYRRAGRRQRSWLSAQHDSRQDARCRIPLPGHRNRQKKNIKSRSKKKHISISISICMNIRSRKPGNLSLNPSPRQPLTLPPRTTGGGASAQPLAAGQWPAGKVFAREQTAAG